jgi:hypothetical protein
MIKGSVLSTCVLLVTGVITTTLAQREQGMRRKVLRWQFGRRCMLQLSHNRNSLQQSHHCNFPLAESHDSRSSSPQPALGFSIVRGTVSTRHILLLRLIHAKTLKSKDGRCEAESSAFTPFCGVVCSSHRQQNSLYELPKLSAYAPPM